MSILERVRGSRVARSVLDSRLRPIFVNPRTIGIYHRLVYGVKNRRPAKGQPASSDNVKLSIQCDPHSAFVGAGLWIVVAKTQAQVDAFRARFGSTISYGVVYGVLDLSLKRSAEVASFILENRWLVSDHLSNIIAGLDRDIAGLISIDDEYEPARYLVSILADFGYGQIGFSYGYFGASRTDELVPQIAPPNADCIVVGSKAHESIYRKYFGKQTLLLKSAPGPVSGGEYPDRKRKTCVIYLDASENDCTLFALQTNIFAREFGAIDFYFCANNAQYVEDVVRNMRFEKNVSVLIAPDIGMICTAASTASVVVSTSRPVINAAAVAGVQVVAVGDNFANYFGFTGFGKVDALGNGKEIFLLVEDALFGDQEAKGPGPAGDCVPVASFPEAITAAVAKERSQRRVRAGMLGHKSLSSMNLCTSSTYLNKLLGCDEIVPCSVGCFDRTLDRYFVFGEPTQSQMDSLVRSVKELGKPVTYIEYGFIASLGVIAEGGCPSYSVLLDDVGLHYNATLVTDLESRIRNMPELDQVESRQLRETIEEIRRGRVSKYNHAPLEFEMPGAPGCAKVLVVDQRYGDKSIECSGADARTFELMLNAAMAENPDADILLKVHPDAITGGKEGHFGKFIGGGLPQNVYLFHEDANPIAFLEKISKVYVCSSQLGFEALMCGKAVVCFGVPFYSGWGLTDDRGRVCRRGKPRTLEQVFKAAYIDASRYVDPITLEVGGIENLVRYIATERNL